MSPSAPFQLGDSYTDAQRAMLVEMHVPDWLIAPSPANKPLAARTARATLIPLAQGEARQPSAALQTAPPREIQREPRPDAAREPRSSPTTPRKNPVADAVLATGASTLPPLQIWPLSKPGAHEEGNAALVQCLFVTHAAGLADATAGQLLANPQERQLATQIAQSIDWLHVQQGQRRLRGMGASDAAHASSQAASITTTEPNAPHTTEQNTLQTVLVSTHYAVCADAVSLVDVAQGLKPTIVVAMGKAAWPVVQAWAQATNHPQAHIVQTYTLAQLMRNGELKKQLWHQLLAQVLR